MYAVCCEDDYFPKGKFKLFNSLFHSVYLIVSIRLFSITDLFAMRYLWDVCNEDKCCVATHLCRLSFLCSHVLRAYCNFESNKRTRLLYLGNAQIIIESRLNIMLRIMQIKKFERGRLGNKLSINLVSGFDRQAVYSRFIFCRTACRVLPGDTVIANQCLVYLYRVWRVKLLSGVLSRLSSSKMF